MPCLYPIILKEKIAVVPCGKCYGCLTRKRSEWTFRLTQEEKHSISSAFVTLTYSSEFLTYGRTKPTLSKVDLQKFIKRLRRYQKRKISYYAIGEYGTKGGRPHYHLLLFNVENKDNIVKAWRIKEKGEKIKPLGKVDIGKVQPASIHYVTKYMLQKHKKNYNKIGVEKPFALMSRRPAIGYQYFSKYDPKDGYIIDEQVKEYHDKGEIDYVTFAGGKKSSVPPFYRYKIFSELTQKKLAEIHKTEAIEKELKEWEKLGIARYYQKINQLKIYQEHQLNKQKKDKL